MHFHTLTVTMTAFLAAVSHAAPKEAAAAEVMISNMPAGISGAIVGPENTFLAESADDCGANSCHGAGGGDLCNDRCKSCGYDHGGCCGTLWQTCCCYIYP